MKAELPGERRRATQKEVFCWVLLGVCFLLFVGRGVIRGARAPWDFRGPYAGTRVWLQGNNCYSTPEALRVFQEAGGDVKPPFIPLYPLTTYVLLSPVVVLNWPAAKLVWLGVLLVCTGRLLVLLVSISGFKWPAPRAKLLLAVAIGYGALHTAIANGQVSVLAVVLSLVSVWRLCQGRWRLAGLLIGVATGIKPQIGGIALLYGLCTGRWRGSALALGVFGLLVVVGAGRPWLGGVHFADLASEWEVSLSHSAAARGGEAFVIASDERANVICMHIFLHSFTDNIPLVKMLVRSAVVASGIAWLLLYWRGRTSIDEWVAFGVPSVLGLMAVYHRTYDAILLLPLVAWGLREWTGRNWLQARLVFLTTLVFAVPGGAFLMTLYDMGILPEVFLTNRVLQALVISHASYTLCILLGLLFWVMLRQTAFSANGRLPCRDAQTSGSNACLNHPPQ